ncbi:interleukin-17F-like [Gastrophryne carolinensis]
MAEYKPSMRRRWRLRDPPGLGEKLQWNNNIWSIAIKINKMKVLLTLVLLFMATECWGHRSHRCKDPSEEHLRSKLLRLAPDSPFFSRQDNIPDLKMKKCPVRINSSSELMQDRSISPWSYRINEDLNRYPRIIIEAYCLCKGCITAKANSMVSVPFYREVPVLQKTKKCKKSRFIYKMRNIRIAQFCICRFP